MKNILYNNLVIDPSPELTPVIRIAPFKNVHLQKKTFSEKSMGISSAYLSKRFHNYQLAQKGRSAISIALSSFNLSKEDVVTIFTTSGNFYISGCVTKEIEKYCRWSRELLPQTKVIFVNHEFGYPYPDAWSLKKYNLPIIEDCAHSFFTEEESIGKVGDFIVYSLSKAFPVQMGGVLVSPKKDLAFLHREDEDLNFYILSYLSPSVDNIDSIKKIRLSNYQYLENRLSSIGITPYFSLDKGVVPGVFLFRWLDNIDYPALKVFMQSNGVESSVFYGKNAFFVPCHDGVTEMEADYMCSLLEYYYKNILGL